MHKSVKEKEINLKLQKKDFVVELNWHLSELGITKYYFFLTEYINME